MPRISPIQRLAGVVALAAVAVAIAAAVSSAGDEEPAARPVTQTSTLLAGIPEHDGVLGDPGAPVTVTEYVDLQCPACAAAAQRVLPTLVDQYVRTGKVRLQVRILHFIGPDSERAARVAAGAERQGRLWRFLEAFYANQGVENSGYVSDAFLREVAAAAGVDGDAAAAAADGDFAGQRLTRANADAQRLGIDSTPTFTVSGAAGSTRVADASAVIAAVDGALAR